MGHICTKNLLCSDANKEATPLLIATVLDLMETRPNLAQNGKRAMKNAGWKSVAEKMLAVFPGLTAG